jgi:hypothetical protein
MRIVYMNSWASLMLRAGGLALFALYALGEAAAGAAMPAWVPAAMLALSAAHPLSVGLRLRRGTPVAVASVAEGALAIALAAALAIAASSQAAAAWVLPVALALAVLALGNGLLQHELVRREARAGAWPSLSAALGAGGAGVLVLFASRLAADAAANAPLQAACALALGAWIMHLALRLRRARRAAARDRLRDLTLGRQPPARAPRRRLRPAPT